MKRISRFFKKECLFSTKENFYCLFFKRKKIIYKCIIAILRKQPFQRTDHEITLLKSAFGEGKFFEERKNELGEECLNRLYKELKYEFVDKRKAVFNLGYSYFL